MKMKRVLAVCACAGFAAPAMAQSFEITHNVVPDLVEGGTVQCANTDPVTGFQRTTDNSLWRSFDLADFGLGDVTVREVEFGIEVFQAPDFGSEVEVTINLYQGPAGARPVTGLTLVGTASQSYPDQSLTIVSMPVEGCVDAGSALVVEIMVPDLRSGMTAHNVAFLGSNGFGENDPSYLSSVPCGILQPTTYPEIDPTFNNIAIIMTVRGDEGHDCTGGPECYADCDLSETLDFFDFLCFQNAFAAGEEYADCDDSGTLDFFDFLCFQDAFAAGCP